MIVIIKKIKKGKRKMQDKGLDFKHKEVVNINNGKRLGYVQDVCADLESGTITSIMVARKRIDINSVKLQ